MEFNDYLQFFGILVLFFLVLYGAYYLSRLLGKMQMKRQVGANMAIIEVLPVGQHKTLQLVRVGNDYMVIAVTRDRITFIERVDEATITLQDGSENIVPFSNFLNKLVHKEKDNESLGGEELDEHHKK